jgi:DNA-directed RNA polymerase specialized sigma24 family protein
MQDLSAEQQIGLAERVASGDREAENELVRYFSPRILAMLCARTRDREASRDLLHDV